MRSWVQDPLGVCVITNNKSFFKEVAKNIKFKLIFGVSMEEGGAIKIMHQENTASKEKKEGLASLQKKYNSVHAPHDIANKYQLPKPLNCNPRLLE